MSRLGRVAAMALAVIASSATLGAPGALAVGRSGTRVRPVERFALLSMSATNGWHLHVGASLGVKPGVQQLGVQALDHEEGVGYDVRRAYATPGGAIRGKLPGVGQIAVHFKQTKEKKLRFTAEQGCTSDGISIERSGWFEGTIKFHGEGGYTHVSRRRAYGQIQEIPREVCRGKGAKRRASGSSAASESVVKLTAGRNLGHGRSLFFSADPISEPDGREDSVDFGATYYHSRRGMFIWASTRKLGRVKDLSVTYAHGSPSEATVEPPAPFTGGATFKLETPTKASWAGDLTADIPTLGTVKLTGPRSWSAICTFAGCSKTLPPGITVIS